jgi:hypothetical protein
MKSRIVGVAVLFMLSLGAGSAFLLAAGPNPQDVYIESMSYGGTGCPQGTVGQSISSDRVVSTLIFDNFVAYTGPSIPVGESRKTCQVNINLHVPPGAGNTIVEVNYRGYEQLAAGQSGRQESVYFFGGDQKAGDGTDVFGPVAKDYLVGESIPLHAQKIEIPACNAVLPLNIKASLAITGPSGAQGQMTTDSIDFRIKQTGKPKSGRGC